MGRKKVNRYYIPAEGDQADRTSAMLKMLEFNTAASVFEEIFKKFQKSGGTFHDTLESLCEIEIRSREENRVVRWEQQAKFPFKRTLEQFDFSFQPSIKRNEINELFSCRFIKKGENVIFLGPPGIGKTHLSIALGREAINKGLETRFLKLDDLVELVRKSSESSLIKIFRGLMRPALLILDDIDFYDPGKNTSAVLFKTMMDRHTANLSTIFTSNKEFNEWAPLFGDDKRASAAIDRIIGRATIINIRGNSFRVKDKIKSLKA